MSKTKKIVLASAAFVIIALLVVFFLSIPASIAIAGKKDRRGVLVQAMPGCSEETLEQLELRSVFFSAISREVADVALEDLAKAWFDGLDMRILSRETVKYQCDCSRDKMEKALIALGRTELQQLIDEDGQAELTCHFCRTAHHFSRQELTKLLERASQ